MKKSVVNQLEEISLKDKVLKETKANTCNAYNMASVDHINFLLAQAKVLIKMCLMSPIK